MDSEGRVKNFARVRASTEKAWTRGYILFGRLLHPSRNLSGRMRNLFDCDATRVLSDYRRSIVCIKWIAVWCRRIQKLNFSVPTRHIARPLFYQIFCSCLLLYYCYKQKTLRRTKRMKFRTAFLLFSYCCCNRFSCFIRGRRERGLSLT